MGDTVAAPPAWLARKVKLENTLSATKHPPPAFVAELPAITQLSSVKVPSLRMPPPSDVRPLLTVRPEMVMTVPDCGLKTRKSGVPGAVLDIAAAATRVEWPDETLRDFVLFDGLMHEIGHHLVQHHRGKRSRRVMRTTDHERYAEAFAAACRLAWAGRRRPE